MNSTIDTVPGSSAVKTSQSAAPIAQPTLGSGSRLAGKRAGMVVFSQYPFDPRPRRAIAALLEEEMSIDLICEYEDKSKKKETLGNLQITRIPIRHYRGGAVSYAYQYFAFIAISSVILAWRSLRKRYDLVYVHNMPDVLVACALIPKLLGAKVILDQHDPMPELMQTIFGKGESSLPVRILRWLEKWSFSRADQIITVNVACKRIFSNRSCKSEKIGVVMNAPAEAIFPYRPANTYAARDLNAPIRIMYHGSLVDRNGLGLAIDALALLQDTLPLAELQVFGKNTPYLEQMLDRVKELGLESKVRYFGPRTLEELVGEIEACDVGVIPNPLNTFTEINTPTRIFEYLALGKPVIAPTTLGIRDYFEPNTLFFFNPGDAGDLASAIVRVASDPKQAIQVAEFGQAVYRAHTWQQERETLVSLVLRALA